MISRLALGTAQFGLPYGIANKIGQIAPVNVARILGHARSMGLMTLDTAIAYGESECRLGNVGVAEWQIVTKLPPIPGACSDVARWAQESVLGSLQRLKIERLYGLLLHRSFDLMGDRGDAVYDALLALKEQGRTAKIGVSVYDPEELDAISPRYRLDLVQAPFNVVDRRIETSGWLERLNSAGIEIHARSIFLQGLLLMDAASRPAGFSRWQPLWDNWQCWLAQSSSTSLQACLSFVLSKPEISRVIFGVDTLNHLEEVLDSVSSTAEIPPRSLICDDLNLINPSRWSAL
jgi:aryl-alcohol dehydrogenase-like predicted oxidoreductase